jgi:hypothetical protein
MSVKVGFIATREEIRSRILENNVLRRIFTFKKNEFVIRD